MSPFFSHLQHDRGPAARSAVPLACPFPAHPYSARLGALGGVIASAMFIVTLSFMFTTPGVAEASAGGLPVISVLPGRFPLKDLVLLSVSV